MRSKTYEEEVFDQWLDIYKRSATTKIILQATSEKPCSSQDLHKEVNKKTGGKWEINEKSMHRSLRRLTDLDLISFKKVNTPKTGLKTKLYSITESGEVVLSKIHGVTS